MKKNKFLSVIILTLAMGGCTTGFFSCKAVKTTQTQENAKSQTSTVITDVQKKAHLPQKTNALSMKMSESPIKPNNLDDFLFLPDCIYIDVRSADAFYKEGHVAGFTNIPFYGYVADFSGKKEPLFEMTKTGGEYLGDKGSFKANYEDSEQVILDILDKNKNIVVISTAGVESCYFLNLLAQLGFNPEKLYNAGSFTNGMGADIAYRTYEKAKYLVEGIELYDTEISYKIKL